jgi:hypothetical protein
VAASEVMRIEKRERAKERERRFLLITFFPDLFTKKNENKNRKK